MFQQHSETNCTIRNGTVILIPYVLDLICQAMDKLSEYGSCSRHEVAASKHCVLDKSCAQSLTQTMHIRVSKQQQTDQR